MRIQHTNTDGILPKVSPKEHSQPLILSLGRKEKKKYMDLAFNLRTAGEDHKVSPRKGERRAENS